MQPWFSFGRHTNPNPKIDRHLIYCSQRHLHHTPRTCETGPGNPSGHAMINMVLWYILADSLSSSKLVDTQLGEASR